MNQLGFSRVGNLRKGSYLVVKNPSVINSFWNWIRILLLVRIWFSPGSRVNLLPPNLVVGNLFLCTTTLYANAPQHPKRCDGVIYDPKTYVGVKKDPRTCLT